MIIGPSGSGRTNDLLNSIQICQRFRRNQISTFNK